MQSNRFTPPRSRIGTDAEPPKPSTVWLVQAVAALLGCVALVGVVGLTLALDKAAVGATGIVVRYAVFIAVLVGAAFTIVGWQQRMPWARWLSLALMTVPFAAGCYVWWFILFVGNPVGVEIQLSPSDDVPLLVSVAIMVAAVVTFVAAGFSASSRAWLRVRDEHELT